MAQKNVSAWSNLTKQQLWLLAILLAFTLLLAGIWLWYDVKITTLNKQLPPKESSQMQTPEITSSSATN